VPDEVVAVLKRRLSVQRATYGCPSRKTENVIGDMIEIAKRGGGSGTFLPMSAMQDVCHTEAYIDDIADRRMQAS
jgi:hypothetical protein